MHRRASADGEGTPLRTPTITLPLVNPLPLLQYAMKIADEALYVSGAEPETVSGEVSFRCLSVWCDSVDDHSSYLFS